MILYACAHCLGEASLEIRESYSIDLSGLSD
jgi:hypothetical protein